MKPNTINHTQGELFQTRLSFQLKPNHELILLSEKINWQALEESCSDMHGPDFKGGQPPKPVRLMIGILLLQYMHNLSDESVIRSWVENPYWQYFCGYDYLQWEFPIDPSSLTRWRKRLGKEKLEEVLKQTVECAVKFGVVERKDLETVIVDTTVQPKDIAYPTDSKLINKSRQRLVALCTTHGITLRQNYNLVSKKLLRAIGGYLHAKQMKRARRAMKQLKTYVGRVVRDCQRKVLGNEVLTEVFANELAKAEKLLRTQKHDKNKLYSLHEEQVDCLSKGKARKPYEFGCKVSYALTHKKGKALVIASEALHGNPYDGHTLASALTLAAKITGVKPKRVFVDDGYKGHGVEDIEVYKSRQKRGITASLKKQMKRRQAIEPHIGHMKNEGKLGLCRLRGKVGDQLHAVLCGAAYNMRLIINHLRFILALILNHIITYNQTHKLDYELKN